MDNEKLVELAKLLGWIVDDGNPLCLFVPEKVGITNIYPFDWLLTGSGMLAVMKKLAELLGENRWLQITQLRDNKWCAIVWDGEGHPWNKYIIARIEHEDPAMAVAQAAYEALKQKDGDTH